MKATTTSGLALLLLAAAAQSTNRYVPGQYTHIVTAMAASSSGDVIIVADGIYPEPTIDIQGGVTITSESGDFETVIIRPDGSDAPLFTATDFNTAATIQHVTLELTYTGDETRALVMDEASIMLYDVKMFNFTAEEGGGTIHAYNGKLGLADCVITGSSSTGAGHQGGAIRAEWSYLGISGGSISNSQADVGGGIYFYGYDEGQATRFTPYLSIVDLALANNTAITGGAAYTTNIYTQNTHTWTGGSVTGNSATNQGGGIFAQGESPDFVDVEFEANTAEYGGALHATAPSLVGCVFLDNTATYMGGAIYGASGDFEGLVFTGNSAEDTVTPNDSYGGAIYSTAGSLTLTDCIFEGNQASSGSATGNNNNFGGAVYCLDGSLTATNCLFTGNEAISAFQPWGGACHTNDEAYFTSCTFADNSAIGPADALGSVVIAGEEVVMLMCNLEGNTVAAEGVGPVEVVGNETITITYTNVYGNLSDGDEGDWVGDIDGLETGTGNKSLLSQFVNSANNDYRLKWTSPLMDTGATGDPDFDLTTQDIGWQKPYTTLYTLTATNSVLPAGRYQIDANTYLGAAGLVVDHDVMIRVAAGKKLQLDDPNNGGAITIGNDDGARTAIVGAVFIPDTPSDIAGDIIFGHGGPTQPCDLQIEGTLFNVGPYGLWFNSSTVSLIGKDGEVTPNCEFRSYGGSIITFANCTGSFRQHDFESTASGALPSVRGVYLHYSDMDIVEVNFDRGNEEPLSPSAYGVVAFGAPTFTSGTYNYTQIANCAFNGSGVYTQGYVPTMFFLAQAGLTGNHMLESRDRAILAYESTLHMAGTSHGLNELEMATGTAYTSSLIALQGSSTLLHLKCGDNIFNHPQALDITRSFINSDQTTAPAVVDWSRNYWSTSCEDGGWSTFDCDPPSDCDLPPWAEPYPTLSTCPTGSLGPCDEYLTISEEYAASLLAQAAYNYSSAWALWKEIVFESPTSDEASLAAGLMKSVALNTSWGAENSTDLVEDLIQAADSAWTTSAPLGVMESTHAWVVEALHGDREVALAQLDTLLATWTDPADQTVISLGIAEVESFPSTGGMSSAGGASMAGFARLEKLQAFQQHLLNGVVSSSDSRTESSPVQPAGFTLSPAMPNPFNPTTQLTLDVTVAGAYHVDLFNLQGQLVHRLLDESLTAGVQTLTVDGSHLSSGVYFVNAVGPKGSQNQKLLLVK